MRRAIFATMLSSTGDTHQLSYCPNLIFNNARSYFPFPFTQICFHYSRRKQQQCQRCCEIMRLERVTVVVWHRAALCVCSEKPLSLLLSLSPSQLLREKQKNALRRLGWSESAVSTNMKEALNLDTAKNTLHIKVWQEDKTLHKRTSKQPLSLS